jgi:L-lactate permease
MALDYVALVLLVVIAALVVYGAVAVWGIPLEIAKSRNHPHQEAIGVATWVSLFTLGILWPFLWIWATLYRPGQGWGFAGNPGTSSAGSSVAELERRVAAIEGATQKG